MLVGLYRARRILIRLDPGLAIGEKFAGPFAGAATGLTGNLRLLDTQVFN